MQIRMPLAVIMAVGILASGLALAGCGQQTKAEAPAPAPKPEVSVAVMEPQRVAISSELAGRTTAYLVAEIRPQVSGIIQNRLFREGADVGAGDLLYRIDPAPFQAAVDRAQAELAEARANLTVARLKAERYGNLMAASVISKQEFDDTDAALKQAEAAVAAKEAALEAARIDLDHTRVISPIPGRIGRSAITQGALVTANQSVPLATVQQLDPIYVDVTQSSVELLRLKRSLASGRLARANGSEAKVKLLLEDGSSYPLEGGLQLSEATVDQSTGVVTLRALFPNPDHELLPGMYVRAIVEEGVDERAILVPQRGVARNAKGEATALVVAAGDTVESRNLRIERAQGDMWLVSSGLKAGDRVIVEGLQKVRPGMTVSVAQAVAAEADK